jgi:FkbM family methyltransferase
MERLSSLATLKAFAVSILCHPLVGRLLRVVFGGRIPSLRFRGWRIDTRSPAVTPRTVATIFWGVYESAELRLVERHLRRDLDVIECGSSLGGVSSAIARRLEPGRRMVCVEANPALVPLLERNVKANAPDTQVTVVNRAIDYERAEVTFFQGDTSTGGRTSSTTGNPGVSIPATRLGDLLAEHGIGDYVLVSDIEGAEIGFITHDVAALAGCRQILLELHAGIYYGNPETEETLIAALENRHGFTLRERLGAVVLLDRG